MPTTYRGYPRVPNLALADGKGAINRLADAIDADVAALVAGMRLLTIVHFTSSGSFSKGAYAGIKAVEVEVIGAGGGSGAARATSGSQISFGCGGGGGGYGHGFILAGSLASSETVTVGAGGIAGTSGSPDGGTGGASAFGAFVNAAGGGGGTGALVSTGASGGAFLAGNGGAVTGTAVDLSAPGDEFGSTDFVTGSFTSVMGFTGHRSGGPYGTRQEPFFGPGLPPGYPAEAGKGIGSGSRGPVNGTSASNRNGAAGSNGRVIVRVYI